ncbi:hypothetical protein [uncultured Brevundimonas sp.]|uniref:hypothetical protein n=1 Tax=uncultured Brevundimonas sp. TaxID=213418 RepID=UPI0030EEBB1D
MTWAATPARTSADPAFLALAASWAQEPARQFVSLVWLAYDAMRQTMPYIDGGDLERSITQVLEPRINDAMTGFEPFYVQHGPFERETKLPAPAQPPEYDLAFVLRADERIMWPLEAKVLETPGAVAAYADDVETQFLTCRYAPFSNSGAMLAYLISGSAADALAAISTKLGCDLHDIVEHSARPNRYSKHTRRVPDGKRYPAAFDCFHLILEYPELTRTKA